jgi:hypothetical protein
LPDNMCGSHEAPNRFMVLGLNITLCNPMKFSG